MRRARQTERKMTEPLELIADEGNGGADIRTHEQYVGIRRCGEDSTAGNHQCDGRLEMDRIEAGDLLLRANKCGLG